VLVAEIVAHYHPKLVDLHNYSGAHGLAQKLYNWNTLNQKVFKRLQFAVLKEDCEHVCAAEPGAIERVLKLVKASAQSTSQGGPRPAWAHRPIHRRKPDQSFTAHPTGEAG
jgi:hypothetical protein